MSADDPLFDEEKTFLQKHRTMLMIAIVFFAAMVVIFVQKKLSGGGSASRKPVEMVTVRLPPPPPTPPPPAATPPPEQEIKQEQKMIDQAPVAENEEKPKDEAPPEAPVSTSIKGDGGADGFGVGAAGNGSQIGGSGAGHQGSKWGWYAGQVQSTIADALRKNAKTRVATLKIKVRVWPDVTGHISRVKAETTNDPALDKAISDALSGLQLKEPPPAGMPAPIVLRISAQR